MIPSFVIAHLLDELMYKMYKNLSAINVLLSLVVQTLIIISIFYLFITYLEKYANEFQTTIAGGFFIAMFFGFQVRYIHSLKQQMRMYIF